MAKKYPAIPKVIPCPGGDVRVSVVSAERIKKFADPDEELYGVFIQAERRIYIQKGLNPEQRNRVLWHELAHVAFEDSGLANGLDRPVEEALADAFSSLVMRVMFG